MYLRVCEVDDLLFVSALTLYLSVFLSLSQCFCLSASLSTPTPSLSRTYLKLTSNDTKACRIISYVLRSWIKDKIINSLNEVLDPFWTAVYINVPHFRIPRQDRILFLRREPEPLEHDCWHFLSHTLVRLLIFVYIVDAAVTENLFLGYLQASSVPLATNRNGSITLPCGTPA